MTGSMGRVRRMKARLGALVVSSALVVAGPGAVLARPGPVKPGPEPERPSRPMRLLQALDDCLLMSRAGRPLAETSRCFTDLAHTFRKGLDYQCWLWEIAKDSPICTGAEDASEQVEPDVRVKALRLAREVLSDIERAAGSGRYTNRNRVRQLISTASRALDPRQRSYSLVSQGGVSLGSWQAGYLYLTTEVLKHHATLVDLPRERSVYATATGASAGAVNALAFGLEGCKRTFTPPEDTLGFKVWVDELALFSQPGKPGLLAPQGNPLALFNDQPLERALELARRELSDVGAKLGGPCAFNLGFVVTHMKPRRVPVHVRVDSEPGRPPVHEVQMSGPRLTERFMLQVGIDASGTPSVTNLELPSSGLVERTVLPDHAFVARLGRFGNPSIKDLLDGVRASGAFPLAFSPVWLDYQTWDVEPGGFSSQRSRFVDGGTLDNTPIGLAVSINRGHPYEARNPWFGDLFTDPNTYLFVNPGVTEWDTRARPDQAEAEAETMLSVFGGFALDLVSTGFEAQLMNTAEVFPFVRENGPETGLPRMSVPERHMPIAGEQLMHFLAFAERDFREFDFVVGMADAREHVRELARQSDVRLLEALDAVERQLRGLARRAPAVAPPPPRAKGRARSLAEGAESPHWTRLPAYRQPRSAGRTAAREAEHPEEQPRSLRRSIASRYQCMRDYYDSVVSNPLGPRPDGQLPASCVHAGTDDYERLLRGMVRYRDWARSAEYDPERALATFIRVVSQEGFEFPDTVRELGRWWSLERPEQTLRSLLETITERLAEKHTLPTGWMLKSVGRVLADTSLFREFPAYTGVGIADDGIEIVAGWPFFAPHERVGLRADTTFRAYRWEDTDVAPRPDAATLSLELGAGPTLVWGPFFNPGTFDFELGGSLFGRMRPLPIAWAREVGFSVRLGLVSLQRLYLLAEYQHVLEQWLEDDYRGTRVDSQRNDTLGLSVGWRFNLYSL